MAVLAELDVILVKALEEDLDDLDEVVLQDLTVILDESLQDVKDVQLVLVAML